MADTNEGTGEIHLSVDSSADGVPGGTIKLGADVVATIAGLAAREVDGIHEVGRGRFWSLGDSPQRGIEAEVGSKQAAFDVDVIVDYGIDIRTVATELRTRIASAVDKMTGREVVEVNINVVGLHFPEGEEEARSTPEAKPSPRVV